jgi:hypothetical protein
MLVRLRQVSAGWETANLNQAGEFAGWEATKVRGVFFGAQCGRSIDLTWLKTCSLFLNDGDLVSDPL